MGLWPFKGGKTHDVRVEEYVDLDGLEYAFEFAENERAYLKRAWICQDQGGEFQVLKEVGHGGMKTNLKIVLRSEYFPTQEDVERNCEEEYGGGRYIVQVTKPYRALCKTYEIDGPPKFQAKAHGKNAANNGILTPKQLMDQEMGGAIKGMMDDDPELKAAMMAAYLKKHLGLELNHKKDDDEDEFKAEFKAMLAQNPEAKQKMFEAELRKRGVVMGEEDDTGMERAIAVLEQAGNLRSLISAAAGDGDNNSIRGMVGDALRALPGILQNGLPALGQQQQVVDAEPLPQPQPQAPTPRHRPAFIPVQANQPAPGPQVLVENAREGYPAPVIVESPYQGSQGGNFAVEQPMIPVPVQHPTTLGSLRHCKLSL